MLNLKTLKIFMNQRLLNLIPQVNQGISVYGNKGSTDQHAWVFILA